MRTALDAQRTTVIVAKSAPVAEAPRARLRLSFRGAKVAGGMPEPVRLGRDPTCEVVLVDPLASRKHCTIERRNDRFFLRDHSSNGTYVKIAGEPGETLLRREELALRGHGWISFGRPTDEGNDSVEYFCD